MPHGAPLNSKSFSMLPAPLLAALVAIGLFAGCAQAQNASHGRESDIEIVLHDGDEREIEAEEQLRRLLAAYDTEPWTFTRSVQIESGVIPHSHPVLTLSTRYLDDDEWQLSTYLHEQAHWFIDERAEAENAVIAELHRRYPEVPVASPEGAGSEYSTYLHLIVNWLELDAMTKMIGEEQARSLLARKHYYQWIYEQVLEDSEEIGALLAEHDLLIRSV